MSDAPQETPSTPEKPAAQPAAEPTSRSGDDVAPAVVDTSSNGDSAAAEAEAADTISSSDSTTVSTDVPQAAEIASVDAETPDSTNEPAADGFAVSTPPKSEQPLQVTEGKQVTSDAGDATPQTKPMKRAAAGSVGKAGVRAKSAASTPAKCTPAAKMPSSAKVSSSSKKFDVLHAKQIAKEPTIYEHDKAKRAKAESASVPHSAARATRSSTAKIVAPASRATSAQSSTPVKKKIVFKPARNHVGVADRPTISSSLKRAEAKRTVPTKAAPFTSTVTAGAKKPLSKIKPASSVKAAVSAAVAKPARALNYKPYTGPLPKYKEDPLFSPVPRGKVAETPAKPKRAMPPAKAGKENTKPAPNARVATPAKARAAAVGAGRAALKPAAASARTPIKKVTSSVVATAKAKDDRRAKFAQDAKMKAAGARQSPRRAAAVVAAGGAEKSITA